MHEELLGLGEAVVSFHVILHANPLLALFCAHVFILFSHIGLSVVLVFLGRWWLVARRVPVGKTILLDSIIGAFQSLWLATSIPF